MICPKCNAELTDTYTFCPQCGSKLPAPESQDFSAPAEAEFNSPVQTAVPEASVFVTQPDDVFVSSSPLTQTMPSPYVSSDVNPYSPVDDVFAAPAVPASFSVSAGSNTAAQDPFATASASPVQPAPPAVPAVSQETVRPAESKPEQPAASANTAQSEGPVKKQVDPFIPKEYKPMTTAGIFWYYFLICIPVVGWICLLAFAIGGKNKSKRSLSRAILIYWLLFFLLLCLAFIAAFIFNRELLLSLFDPDSWTELGNNIYQIFINH